MPLPGGVAICWGLKEPAYAASPLLPDLDQELPRERTSLEQMVEDCHSAHGSEISFYWCFPFWVLAAQLQKLEGVVMATPLVDGQAMLSSGDASPEDNMA